jgi:hypothetical protein
MHFKRILLHVPMGLRSKAVFPGYKRNIQRNVKTLAALEQFAPKCGIMGPAALLNPFKSAEIRILCVACPPPSSA